MRCGAARADRPDHVRPSDRPQNLHHVPEDAYYQKGPVHPSATRSPNQSNPLKHLRSLARAFRHSIPYLVAWHCLSVLALVALLGSKSSMGAMAQSAGPVTIEDSEGQRPSTSGQAWDDTALRQGQSGNARQTFDSWLLSVSRNTSTTVHNDQCLTLDAHRITELCRLKPNNRIKRLRKVYFHVFTFQGLDSNRSKSAPAQHSSALPSLPGMTMYDLFLLDLCNVTSMEDFTSIRNLESLQYNATKCVYSDDYDQCMQCFGQLMSNLQRLELEVKAFNHVLAQNTECSDTHVGTGDTDNSWQSFLDFDEDDDTHAQNLHDLNIIDPDFDTFSSMSDCENCRKGYLLWLLVQHMSSLWNKTLCSNWCVIAELTCPHIRTTLQVQSAGFPMFRCHDPEIGDRWTEEGMTDGRPGIMTYDQTLDDDCRCVDACQFQHYLKGVFTEGPEDRHLKEDIMTPYGAVTNMLLQCKDYRVRCPIMKQTRPAQSKTSGARSPRTLVLDRRRPWTSNTGILSLFACLAYLLC